MIPARRLRAPAGTPLLTQVQTLTDRGMAPGVIAQKLGTTKAAVETALRVSGRAPDLPSLKKTLR